MSVALGVVLDAYRGPCPHCGKSTVALDLRYYLRGLHGLTTGDARAIRCQCTVARSGWDLGPGELLDAPPAWEGP